jgi:AcrR family transcriptional regulator
MQGTVDRIRAAALTVFVTNGYTATSMAQIRTLRGSRTQA